MSDSKDCPFCGEEIKAAAIKCRYCGEMLPGGELARHDPGQGGPQDVVALEETLFEGRPSALFSLWHYVLAVITLGIAFIYYWIKSLSTRYRITTQRVKIEEGIFSKSFKNIDLYRIDDFHVISPLSQRMVGHAELHLRTSDRDLPLLVIHGLKEVHPLSERMRSACLSERKRLGVKVWANA